MCTGWLLWTTGHFKDAVEANGCVNVRQSPQLTKAFEVETTQLYTLPVAHFAHSLPFILRNCYKIPFTNTACLECSGAWALLAWMLWVITAKLLYFKCMPYFTLHYYYTGYCNFCIYTVIAIILQVPRKTLQHTIVLGGIFTSHSKILELEIQRTARHKHTHTETHTPLRCTHSLTNSRWTDESLFHSPGHPPSCLRHLTARCIGKTHVQLSPAWPADTDMCTTQGCNKLGVWCTTASPLVLLLVTTVWHSAFTQVQWQC